MTAMPPCQHDGCDNADTRYCQCAKTYCERHASWWPSGSTRICLCLVCGVLADDTTANRAAESAYYAAEMRALKRKMAPRPG